MSNEAKSRRFLLLISGLVALVLGGASFAWACGPQAVISVKPTSGPPGTNATVSGAGFREGTIQIRWDSATGSTLGTASGPSFSVGVTIPEASAGVHHIVAVHTETQSTAPASFEVTAAQQPRDPAPEPQPQPNRGNTSRTVSGGGGGSRTSGGERAVQPARSGPRQQEAPARVSSAPARVSSAPASSQPRAVTTDSGRVVFGGSVAPATVSRGRDAARPSLNSAGAALGRKPQAAAGVPSERTASADLWSGSRSGDSPSLTALEPVPESDSGSLLPVGLGLLALGAVGLVGGLLVAGTRRRRAAGAGRQDQRNE